MKRVGNSPELIVDLVASLLRGGTSPAKNIDKHFFSLPMSMNKMLYYQR